MCGWRVLARIGLIIGARGGLEIKCLLDEGHMGLLIDGPGDTFKPQVQGNLAGCELEFWDFQRASPERRCCPTSPACTYRDEPYIAKMGAALTEFPRHPRRDAGEGDGLRFLRQRQPRAHASRVTSHFHTKAQSMSDTIPVQHESAVVLLREMAADVAAEIAGHTENLRLANARHDTLQDAIAKLTRKPRVRTARPVTEQRGANDTEAAEDAPGRPTVFASPSVEAA